MTSRIYRRRVELLEADIGDELVALNADGGQCFGFNEVATVIWRSLAQPRSFDELHAQLIEQYSVSAGECARELEALLNDLVAKGLAESVDDGNVAA